MSDLVLENVSFDRGGRRIIHDVNCTFPSGRLTVVVGPNGAGKTTLLKLTASLLVPSSGIVRLDGREVASLSRKELARRRAYLPQRAGVKWPLSVRRVVALGLVPTLPAFGRLSLAAERQIQTALQCYDLASIADRPTASLSGGELARVMMACATVGKPEILIVDEPTAGLDPRHAIEVGQKLRALAHEGCTVIVSLHDLNLALKIADNAIAMKEGRIVAGGSLTRVFCEDVLTSVYDVHAQIDDESECRTVRFVWKS